MDDFIQRAFGADGHLSKMINGYTPRAPQIMISTKVGHALEKNEHLLCEAGTGTGKSLGYLTPAARWAIQNKKTVIVCTHTIPLMTQIVNVELPRVASILEMEDMKLKYQLVKGKDHYLCHTKVEKLWQEKLLSADEDAKVIQKIHSRMSRDGIGERTELGFDVEDKLWRQISASRCPATSKPDNCMLEVLKGQMQKAHIIVTNFAYFFNDLKMRKKTGGNGSLPPYDAVIFDEAHEIEDVCCKVFEKEVSVEHFENLFENLYKRNSVNSLGLDQQMELNELRQTFQKQIDDVYQDVRDHMKNEDGKQIAFKLMNQGIEVSEVVSTLGAFIEKVKSYRLKGVSDVLERMFESNDDLDFISSNERKSWAYWATIESRGQLILHAAPLYPKAVLSKGLFDKVTVVLASATMSTITANGKTFAFYAGRVGAKDYDYSSIIVDSPFDYKNKTMIICPDDAPDASSSNYNTYLGEKLEEILMYTGGRMLVLFTSFETMNQVAKSIESFCVESGLNLLIQYPGCDREFIIKQLKTEPRTVVLGCSSFWTGVDVPGDALTTVVIVKLPFPMPNEPLIQAQLAVIEKAERSSFFDYMFPKMMVKLQQGFGRLNRSMQCQGAVIILDNRMYTKRYGKMIIKTLPTCKYSRNVSDLVHILPC
ncbi:MULTISPECIES: ATP-dependent DNA helicase [Paenibacillus]|uniref:ATP-dependent DNA helicase n=1 Tax=Paenibacillus TaxID=44249 RepID=UPI0004120E08|nr:MULTISPECIES: ATP-dependent DNA helicase [Paenibacillus]KGP77698.1 hypothetical protein P364_0131990 [Paenibacillus sp. MAEPY2]KGP78683.1 hypothetical protein P363_0131930 [Paenibacillus sp. MAEPY1]OZQ62811.1 DNA helicase, Rad3 [Paenibacillus taichungensis]